MDYPLWNLFLTILRLFIWIMLITLVFRAVMNMFRSRSLSGGGIVRGAQLAELAACATGVSSPTRNSTAARLRCYAEGFTRS